MTTLNSDVLPLNELVQVTRTAGPEEIRRLNRRRTVTLQIRPPADISLEDVLTILKRDVASDILEQLLEDGSIQYTGAADKLEIILTSIQGSFLLTIAILYLLMNALFSSFKDSLLVMLSIPLATCRRGDSAAFDKYCSIIIGEQGFSTHGFNDHDWICFIARHDCQ